MSSKKTLISAAVGTAFAATFGSVPIASAADNPFAMQSLDKGYMAAQAGKMGEGKCGGAKSRMGDGKCGEGKCGMSMMDANKDGKVSKEEFTKHHDAMFEKMDANKDGSIDKDEMGKMMEGKCGGAKPKAMEGKCGGMK